MTHPIIKRQHVQSGGVSTSRGEEGAHVLRDEGCALSPGEKGVRLLHEEGDVRALEFTCGCGEVKVIELQYPGDSDS